jgi:hypothetical protein
METASPPREVLFAAATVTDMVHVASEVGTRSFKTLCCPQTTFYGDLAKEIPKHHQRCPRCAAIVKAALAKESRHAAKSPRS